MEICWLLLQYGADVNATGGEQGSALRAASRNGHVDTVRLLLEKGADVNAFGRSALKAAARLGRFHPNNRRIAKQITRILLEHGAHEEDITAYDSDSEEDVDTDTEEDVDMDTEEDVDTTDVSDSSRDDSSSSESDD
jgi:DNA-binding SARP family transcriptional activator